MRTKSLNKLKSKEYAIGSKSEKETGKIMASFHKEVVRQILLGNRVMLPGGITIEIIRHVYEPTILRLIKNQPRLGFNYKVRITYDKLKVKKVKFTPSSTLDKKLTMILKETDFEYKLVDYGYK